VIGWCIFYVIVCLTIMHYVDRFEDRKEGK